MKRPVIFAVALAIGSAGCGYRFVRRSAALPGGGRKIFAPTFDNATAEPGLDALFTEALREELADADAAGGEDAPLVARGEVSSVGGGPALVTTDRSGAPTRLASYRVSAMACVRLMEGGKPLGNTCVNGFEDYQPGADPLAIEAGRRLALRRLARRLMREALERLAGDF